MRSCAQSTLKTRKGASLPQRCPRARAATGTCPQEICAACKDPLQSLPCHRRRKSDDSIRLLRHSAQCKACQNVSTGSSQESKNFQAKSLKRHERTKEGRTRAIKKSISRDGLPYRSSAGVCPDPGHATKPRGARGTAGCAHHHRSRSRPDAGQQLHPSPGDAGRGLHPRPHHLDCTADPAHSFATSHQRTPGQPDGQRWLQRPNLAQLHPVCRPPAAAAKHATRRRVVAKPSPRKNRQAPGTRP